MGMWEPLTSIALYFDFRARDSQCCTSLVGPVCPFSSLPRPTLRSRAKRGPIYLFCAVSAFFIEDDWDLSPEPVLNRFCTTNGSRSPLSALFSGFACLLTTVDRGLSDCRYGQRAARRLGTLGTLAMRLSVCRIRPKSARMSKVNHCRRTGCRTLREVLGQECFGSRALLHSGPGLQ